MNLFVQIAPINTAFSLALERVLSNMGFQLDHKEKDKKGKHRKGTIEEVDDNEDGYEHPDLLLPCSVLDGCEAWFKAADEKREKASTEFFEDTAIMVLLCKKQFNVVTLMETLFQHLPLTIVTGLLYDAACSFKCSCQKWGFLSRFMGRLAFAVSVFHAFGHEWACQLLYHLQKHLGFGFTDGKGCERFWHSISHLIAHLQICGYHDRLYTLDTQIDHMDKASLLRLDKWIWRHHVHSAKKHREAKKALAECGKLVALLHEQWAMQVKAKTKPLPSTFLEAVEEDDPDATMHQVCFEAGQEALAKAEEKLCQKESALGVNQHQALKKLATSQYMHLRMNTCVLKHRLRDHLRLRKFELDKVEHSFQGLVNNQKLYSHTKLAVKCREPTISKLNTEYNKLCKELCKVIKDRKAPAGAIAPLPIPPEELWQLDVDNGIWQDIGLDDDDGEPAGEPPLRLCNDKVRSGIKAMLELDQCNEEDIRLRKEKCALQVWFAEEWAMINLAVEQAESAANKYQLQLLRDNLMRLCATWDKVLPDLGIDDAALPPWGPTAAQLALNTVLCHAEEEQECMTLNEQVMMLRDLAAASPKNTMKAKDYDAMHKWHVILRIESG
ncbi:hypothetical protein B0H10DRAFT_2233998 [Mycena sp. CBHHK59/15]|nr:hypothetical protein B0H10DRAFT_2233998 [Mycena sp. CBHHK59/15]